MFPKYEKERGFESTYSCLFSCKSSMWLEHSILKWLAYNNIINENGMQIKNYSEEEFRTWFACTRMFFLSSRNCSVINAFKGIQFYSVWILNIYFRLNQKYAFLQILDQVLFNHMYFFFSSLFLAPSFYYDSTLITCNTFSVFHLLSVFQKSSILQAPSCSSVLLFKC